jgi:type III pantothenate kinase
MLLTIDVGNTNTVFGLFAGEELIESWRVKTDPRSTADEMWLIYHGLLGDRPITGLAACSTVPAVLTELRTMIARYFAKMPAVVVEPGVRVGADRIVNTLAAYHLYGGPAIVVDFGTSTNFDVVSARGEFLGGALAPGIEISIDALAARAARLLKVELVRPRSVIGKTTVEALQSGILYGFVGQIDGLVRRITAELGGTAVVVATGGLAGLVIAESETIQHHQPDLTLLGLRLVYVRNQPAA